MFRFLKNLNKFMNQFRKGNGMEAFPEFYEHTTDIINPSSNLKGNFTTIKGITVHYTADTKQQRVIDVLEKKGLKYHFLINHRGEVVQIAPLTHYVFHAGKSEWNGATPNQHHIAIALLSWGFVTKDNFDRFTSWSGEPVDQHRVKMRTGNVPKTSGMYWDAATPSQESALVDLCIWCCQHGILPENICGHDECCIPPGRKLDPGGVLSIPMTKFRALIQERLKNNRVV